MEYRPYWAGEEEMVTRYEEMRPFEIDGIVYVPPKVVGGGTSLDENGDWAQSLPMVDLKRDHSPYCLGCRNAREDNLLIVVGGEGA